MNGLIVLSAVACAVMLTGCGKMQDEKSSSAEADAVLTDAQDVLIGDEDEMNLDVEMGSYVFTYDERFWDISERQDGSAAADLSYKLPDGQMMQIMISSDGRGSLDEVAEIYEGNLKMITELGEGRHEDFGGMPAYIAEGVPIGEDDKDCATKLIAAQPEGKHDVLVICMRYSFPKGEINEQALAQAQAVLDSCMPMSERIKNGKVVL